MHGDMRHLQDEKRNSRVFFTYEADHCELSAYAIASTYANWFSMATCATSTVSLRPTRLAGAPSRSPTWRFSEEYVARSLTPIISMN